MSESTLVSLGVNLIAGGVLGALYMLGLWHTTRLLPHVRSPAALMAASFVGRAAILLGALWWLSDGHWSGLAAAMAGFLTARTVAVARVRREATP